MAMETMEIIPINFSNLTCNVERLPTEYQMDVGWYYTYSNPRHRFHLNVEQVRTEVTGYNESSTYRKFDSESIEINYLPTEEQIKSEIENLLYEFHIMDADYVQGISERLSVDAAAKLRETETLGVSLVFSDYVRISYRVQLSTVSESVGNEVPEFEQDFDTKDEAMDTMEIIAVNCSNSSSTVERLPIEYQMHVYRYPTNPNSNPWYKIHLNVEKARIDMKGNIQFTDDFYSEDVELDYSSTAEKIKLEVANRLHRFGITDVDYVEGISERLSVDAAAELRQTERIGVSLSITDYVCITRRVDRMCYVQGEDEVCCAICMEGVMGEDEVTKLPCSHILHSHCLARWMQINRSCPLCRIYHHRVFNEPFNYENSSSTMLA